MTRRSAIQYWGPALLGLGILVLPLIVKGGYFLSSMIFVGLNSIVAIGLSLLMGFAGQISLGQAAFYGLGAYAAGILSTSYGISPLVSIGMAGLITAGVAYLMGRAIFRLRGHYLAMATLGLGIIVYIIFVEWSAMTGGPSGLTGIPYLSVGKLVFNTDLKFYYLVWAVVLTVLVISLNIVDSRVGRALRAVNGSEIAAESIGIDSSKYKVQVMVLSALYASIGGSLYCFYITFLNPPPFGFMASVKLVVMVVVGGLASLYGALFGAAVVILLGELLRDVMPKLLGGETFVEYEMVAYGLILMVVMIFLPGGVIRGLGLLYDRVRRNRPSNPIVPPSNEPA